MTKGLHHDRNGFVFNTSRTLVEERIINGKAFSFDYLNDSFGSNDTVEILIDNPSDSVVMGMQMEKINTTIESTIEVFKEVDVTSNGNSIKTDNRKMGSEETSVINAYESGDYDTTDKERIYADVSGAKKAKMGGESQATNRVIPPGYNILTVIENTSSHDGILTVDSSWWEADIDEYFPNR